MKELTVLVIDDDVFKTNDISKALEQCGVRDIIKVDNQEDAFEIIYSNSKIGLIVTDMHYPVKKGEVADTKAGFIFVERMEKEKINIPVIICSSLNFEAPNVAGVVWYNKMRDLREDFKNIILTV